MDNLIKKYMKNYKSISNYYHFLIEKVKQHKKVDFINEWLIDNYYLIVECKNLIKGNRIKLSRELRKSKKIYNAISEIIIKNNYNISYKQFIKELNNYQRIHDTYFSYIDLSLAKIILIIIYQFKLAELCNENYKNFLKKDNVSDLLKSLKEKNVITLNDIMSRDNLKKDTYFIFELNNQLKSLGNNTKIIFKELNEYLNKENISLKTVLNDNYLKKEDNTLLISNIFNNIKSFMEYDTEDIFKKVSECEKYLNTDKVYSKMTVESKELYRNIIIKKSRRKKISEYKYIELLQGNSSRHIGFSLFKNSPKKSIILIYIVTIILLTVITSIFLTNYFLSYKFLGFLILLIPTSQLIVQVVNQIIQRCIKTKPLPKMDFTRNIPEEYTTMVVIPTIITTEQKIRDVFDKLETFYLMNKSNNLYFTLLADAKASQNEIESYDKIVSDYGLEYAEKLNRKYHKNIFNFLYRKRVWNTSENCYLGYERKRGALLQFNRILLHNFSSKDLAKYFYVNTLEHFDIPIKYVITLDSDTEPVLNSLLKLIGCMAHPLNQPVLNQKETRVIDGYAIMQPRVNINISSTNKSLYSQIFAGIGGFDTYSSVAPNVYQDLFKEGSYIGKGIYNLEVFDQILYKKLPDNMILSHDLLEGNYLRCGYVSDVEFIDGFPSDFLVDASRKHRWARGDVQILPYIFPKVKNYHQEYEKNPVNLLGKWKIFDNILRMFSYPTLLLIMILGLSFSKYKLLWLGYILLIISFPILVFFKNKLYLKQGNIKNVYYKDIIYGIRSLLIRSYIVVATLPYHTKLYLDAFIRSIYRLTVSHKNLLNWITAEEVEKNSKLDFRIYITKFIINFIIGLIILILGIVFKNLYLILTGLIFISAPIIVYYVSKDIKEDKVLGEKENEKILKIAVKTWEYFQDNLKSEYNYLIPDNYQENREEKVDFRTSPTNIGFSLTSVIAAYELEFIRIDECIDYLKNIITTIDSLEKWNGHLYNWYNIKTKEVLNPKFISTVDSGNLIASLIMTVEFLRNQEEIELIKICEKLIKNTNFNKLYTKLNVLSIGYDTNENILVPYNYNKFASESRLTSFVAIAKGDIPIKHWFSLDKSLTIYKKHKGLISWSGTAFEYYMPFLFMKNYKNTLLDESYKFAHFCQKSYIENIDKNLPFGISESAYNELDNALNYKYYSFSVPYLNAKEERNNRLVISPYSSLMELELYPRDIYENIIKFEKLSMLSKYGFYESYDVSNNGIVKAFFAHHQGMSLLGLTNYLKKDTLKEYFHQNVRIKTYEILLQEKVQLKTAIDMKISKYKKQIYNKEVIENDIRCFNYISDMPEVSVLSNKKYCLLMNDRGASFSRYRTLQLNRYRKITEQDYGIFFYIKDLDTKKVWSNTYAPINKKCDDYGVVFATDRIKFIRKDDNIVTKTEIIVTRDHNAEIRKLTFTNGSENVKRLQITSYTEPIICENPNDISHRVFNSMFLNSEFDKKNNALITKRISREGGLTNYMINYFIIENPLEEYSYETDRFTFIGRNKTYQEPNALNKELTNHSGTNIEPIMALRNSIEIPANGKVSIYFINGFGRSLGQLREIVNSYNTTKEIENAFTLATLANIVNTKVLNITGSDMRLYNTMLNYLYQTTKIAVNEKRKEYLKKNALAQNALWKYGISGDRPIILVNIKDISNLSFVMEILKAFEYFKNKSIFVDIIILNSGDIATTDIIRNEINDELYRMYNLNSFYHTPGGVYLLDYNKITEEELSLLRIVPRLMFDIDPGVTLEEEIYKLQNENRINDYRVIKNQKNISSTKEYKLEFDNGYGGFQKQGREYVVYNKDTPTPWSNVIANKNFGTIITNNGCGYTYAYNSGEFKLSSWTNEMVLNDKSEGIKINGEIFDPEVCTHGFGYSILESETAKIATKLTEFVATDENVKIYLVNLKNTSDKKENYNLTFYINPTLGNYEEKTARHILTEWIKNDNYLKLRNVYSINFGDVNVFMSSSEKITSVTDDRVLVKDITVKVELDPGEVKTISFTLGCNKSMDKNLMLIYKYGDVKNCIKELNNVKNNWDEMLGTIKVKTPDKSFNYALNGWYLYQSISSRIMARAGFYQVSGAFGYRDQLQDAMNICMVNKEYSKKQILSNAAHQFRIGDVLHWWHEANRFGLRSRYKDDYLWLVYATIHYLDVTDDYSILDELVPYVEGEELTEHETERGMIYYYSKDKATLFKHCLLSINYSMKQLGKHGLPLMGGGDWNDGMNMVGIKGKGESVWLGFFLYDIINRFVEVMKKYEKNVNVSKYLKFNEKLKENLNTKGYDRDYYLRAYFDNGDKLGSYTNTECKIDLISQAFSILSGVVEEDNIPNIIEQVEENLVDKNNKIIKLLTPAFKSSLNNPGYIKSYPEGIRENGGQYTHATSWYIMALIKAGYNDLAYNYYQMINPITRSMSFDSINKYQVEPYVIAADIYSNKSFASRGGWTWYTGSSAWYYRIGIEEILGFKLKGNILEIKPSIPKEWDKLEIEYRYIDALYHIKLEVGNKNEIIINGQIKNKIVLNDKGKYDVIIMIKRG